MPPKLVLATVESAPELSEDVDRLFELAAETFRVMSSPTRLKIINQLCTGEKNVGQLLELVQTTQPNMSQHLNTLYKAGIVGRRRDGVQVYYRLVNEQVVAICRTMCGAIAAQENLTPA